MEQKRVDQKLVDRVKKLLALAADGGATEAEAALAAERARQMMADHGITTATIEAAGGEGESRVKEQKHGHVGKPWMRAIMRALCEQSFVLADWNRARPGEKAGSWQLWGRESAVTTVRLMHEYLVRTVDRTARERGTPTDEIYKAAMGERIAERISERHAAAMAQQAREARERQAAASHPASIGNALVVVLEDYAQKERDLNEDLRLGRAPGTTRQLREQEERERQARIAERQARDAERQAERDALLAQDVDPDVAEYVLYGYSIEDAARFAERQRRPETDAERARREARENRESREYWQRASRRAEREHARQNHPSARAGRAAGDSVGLDAQVSNRRTTVKQIRD